MEDNSKKGVSLELNYSALLNGFTQFMKTNVEQTNNDNNDNNNDDNNNNNDDDDNNDDDNNDDDNKEQFENMLNIFNSVIEKAGFSQKFIIDKRSNKIKIGDIGQNVETYTVDENEMNMYFETGEKIIRGLNYKFFMDPNFVSNENDIDDPTDEEIEILGKYDIRDIDNNYKYFIHILTNRKLFIKYTGKEITDFILISLIIHNSIFDDIFSDSFEFRNSMCEFYKSINNNQKIELNKYNKDYIIDIYNTKNNNMLNSENLTTYDIDMLSILYYIEKNHKYLDRLLEISNNNNINKEIREIANKCYLDIIS